VAGNEVQKKHDAPRKGARTFAQLRRRLSKHDIGNLKLAQHGEKRAKNICRGLIGDRAKLPGVTNIL
jgi:hypothetical protein